MRVPPHDIDAEESVLGACLESQNVADLAEVVKRADFYKPAHRKIFEALVDLYQRGEATDAIMLAGELTSRDELEEVGGKPYIAGLMGHYSSKRTALDHARVVAQLSRLRSLLQVNLEIIDLIYDQPKDVDGVFDFAGSKILGIVNEQMGDTRHAPRSLLQDLPGTLEELEADSQADKPLGFTTGLKNLDDLNGGFQRGRYIVVGADTSKGKTSLLTQIGVMAARQERTVLIATLEQPRRELIHRILAQEANVDVSHLTNPQKMIEDDWVAISKAAGDIPTGRIYFTDGSVDLGTLQTRVRRVMQKAGGLDVLVIDYVQLIKGSGRVENRTQEIGLISRSLKQMANEFGLCVFAASQLNRSATKENRAPTVADLRESGSLEQDADMVILLHRPTRKAGEAQLTTMVPTDLLIRKNRHGPIGKVETIFNAPVNRFEEEE